MSNLQKKQYNKERMPGNNPFAYLKLPAKETKQLPLEIISNRVLLMELKSDKVGLFRKKAIVNALDYARQLSGNTSEAGPYKGFIDYSTAIKFHFATNKVTNLIHVITEFEALSYHPGYVFENL